MKARAPGLVTRAATSEKQGNAEITASRAAPQASPPLRLIVNHELERLIAARAAYIAARYAAERAGKEITPQLWGALGELADARRAWLSRRPSPAALARWLWRLEA